VSTRGPAALRLLSSTRYSDAQLRTAAVALDLFAEHGVNGTSLQMIADALGVTKAAIYHQFKTKEAIVVAAVDVELGGLEAALDAAEAGDHGPGAVDILLREVIDHAVGRRRMVTTLQNDPVVVRLLARHDPFQRFMERLFRVLLGQADDREARVRVAMVASAIGGAVTHPLVADLEDDELKEELLSQAVRFLSSGD
jgi:AcrR family transcriptional regulator